MSRPTANQRLFIAIHPPIEIVRSMVAALGALRLPAHRITREDHIHLTIHFIGDVAVKEIDRVRESVERSASGIGLFTLTPQRLITLPQRGPARLIACATDAPPQLLELHRRLVHRLAQRARSHANDRFLPHHTLCRFRPPAAVVLDGAMGRVDPFSVERIRLMRSVLKPEGAEHFEVSSMALE